MAIWTLAVEGPSDEAVIAAVLRANGHDVGVVHGKRGKHHLDGNLRGYASAARHAPWLIVRDLDQDATCAAELLQAKQPGGHPGCVRIAVRAIEAWLLADPACAQWLGIAPSALPREVEGLDDPKATLVQLARRSRRSMIREDIVPTLSRPIGPGYVDQVRTFCATTWTPAVAARRSESLARLIRHIQKRTS